VGAGLITEFKGERGSFNVCIDRESWTIQAIVYGVEAPDEFGIKHQEPIDWRLDEKNHSPTGLEWGYGGSGPSQLAWCILRECGLTQPQTAKLYMQFKSEVVANLPRDGFTLTRQQVMNWVKKTGPGT
jgi:hypothetical protein